MLDRGRRKNDRWPRTWAGRWGQVKFVVQFKSAAATIIITVAFAAGFMAGVAAVSQAVDRMDQGNVQNDKALDPASGRRR